MKKINVLFTLAITVVFIQHVRAQSVAEKTTSTTTISNLVGIADRYNTGSIFQLADSSAMFYCTNNCGRGGDLAHLQKFDAKTTWGYNPFTNTYYNENKYLQTFDAHNNLLSYITLISDTATGADINNTQTVYWYNAANQVTQMVEQNWPVGVAAWNNLSTDYYTYFAGKLQLDLKVNWSGVTGTFSDTVGKTEYYYDVVSGNIIELINYTYDNVFLHNFVFATKTVYTYNSSNQLTAKQLSTYNNATTAFVNTNLYTYWYDTVTGSGNKIADQYQYYNTATNVWTDSTLMVYSSFSAGNADTSVFYVWDTTAPGMYHPITKYAYMYNSFATPQMTKKIAQSWNAGGGFWEYAFGDSMNTYYYNTVTVNAVNNIIANDLSVSVYPVPADNNLYIDVVSLKEATELNITVTDIMGRTIQSWSVPSTASYKTELSLANFAAGTYIVKINTALGQVAKQIVVNR
jgi:Secretion system C-terminal sorting domain